MNPNIKALTDIIEKRKAARRAAVRQMRTPVAAPQESTPADLTIQAEEHSSEGAPAKETPEPVPGEPVITAEESISPEVSVNESPEIESGIASNPKKKYKKKGKSAAAPAVIEEGAV